MGWTIGIVLGGLTLLWAAWNFTLDALWQPTDRVTVRRLLLLAQIQEGEHVVDWGCGDGRFVVTAAREFGARATGIEIDPFRVLWGRLWILLAGLKGRARIAQGNMYAFDVYNFYLRVINQLCPEELPVSFLLPTLSLPAGSLDFDNSNTAPLSSHL